MPMRFMTEWLVAIRTRMIDEYIQKAIAEGIDGVLNLGAGLDTRPYRMDLAESFLWVEADYPRMITFKETKLRAETPRCRLERVAVDLANPAERRAFLAGIDAQAKKLLVLTEGVVPYLSVEEAGALANDLRAMPHVRYWVLEYISAQVMKFRDRSSMSKKTKNAPFRFRPTDWFGFFRERGWQLKEMRYFAEEGERLKRPPSAPFAVQLAMKLRKALASKGRREALRKVAGYAMLEPVT
jgi:methyltransferase (TIGR00027 family)